MSFKLLYPEFKTKALTFSYDDGQIFDRRLVEIFNRYGLKATFHLNSGTLDTEGFLRKDELSELFEGHEIACHGVLHEFPTHLSPERLVQEFYQDRLTLETCTRRIIRGCSYAYGEYNDRVVRTLKTLGFAYSRTVESTGRHNVPRDFSANSTGTGVPFSGCRKTSSAGRRAAITTTRSASWPTRS